MFRPSARRVSAFLNNERIGIVDKMLRLENGIRQMINFIIEDAELTDQHYLAIVIQTSQLLHPIRIHWRPLPAMTDEVIATTLERVLQSPRNFAIDESVHVNVIAMRRPVGGSRRRARRKPRHTLNTLKNCAKDKNMYVPQNDDQMCAARCIVYGITLNEGGWMRSRNFRRAKRTEARQAYQLCEKSGLDPTKPCGTDELENFQQYLSTQGYCLRVYAAQDEECFYKGQYTREDVVLPLLLADGHCMLIKSMAQFCNTIFYCATCDQPHNHKDQHRCGNYCLQCYSPTCMGRNEKLGKTSMTCRHCCRSFYGDTCFRNHLGKQTQCKSTTRLCTNCFAVYKLDASHTAHQCYVRYCAICQDSKPRDHKCFIAVKHFRKVFKKKKKERRSDQRP